MARTKRQQQQKKKKKKKACATQAPPAPATKPAPDSPEDRGHLASKANPVAPNSATAPHLQGPFVLPDDVLATRFHEAGKTVWNGFAFDPVTQARLQAAEMQRLWGDPPQDTASQEALSTELEPVCIQFAVLSALNFQRANGHPCVNLRTLAGYVCRSWLILGHRAPCLPLLTGELEKLLADGAISKTPLTAQWQDSVCSITDNGIDGLHAKAKWLKVKAIAPVGMHSLSSKKVERVLNMIRSSKTFPTYDEFEGLGYTRGTISKCLNELDAKGFIAGRRRRKRQQRSVS